MITRDECATSGWPVVERAITITSDGLLRVSEVCAILNVNRHTVYKLIDNDVLPVVRVNARVVRISASAVQQMIAPSDH